MSESDDTDTIEIADEIVDHGEPVFGDIVEALRQMSLVKDHEIVTEMDLEIRLEEPVRVTHYETEVQSNE